MRAAIYSGVLASARALFYYVPRHDERTLRLDREAAVAPRGVRRGEQIDDDL